MSARSDRPITTRKVFLHIGTEKTGTTSIQSFLMENEARLLQKGVALPTSLGIHGNKANLMALAMDDDTVDSFFASRKLLDKDRRVRRKQEWLREFYKEMSEREVNTWIISSELLQSRLRKPSELVRLRTILDKVFAHIEVVVYIRKPIDTALALLSTSVKSGVVNEGLPAPTHPYWATVCNHRQTIERWGSVFPHLSVRLFDRSAFKEGDLLADFSALCGLSMNGLTVPNTRANTSLSPLGLSLMNEMNRIGAFDRADRDQFIAALQAQMPQPPNLLPSAEEYNAYEEAFAESNEWVRAKYFPHRTSLFDETHQTRNDDSISNTELRGLAALLKDLWKQN